MPLKAITQADFEPRTYDQAAKRFLKKAAMSSEAFDKLTAEAKAHAFRVAGVHKASLIQSIRKRIARAIRDGRPWPEIRRELLEIFDVEGVPAPSLARLKMAFTQNVQTAYNDGRREVLDDPEIAAAFPFRQYLTVGNGTAGVRGVRPTHAALHRKVFAWDDPFWNAHTPPWEYGCRCTTVALTAGQVKRMGVKVANLGYVQRRIKVKGQSRRGIKANPNFVRGGFDMKKIEADLRKVLEG